jgi:ligand-binding sensor domain-containing protein
VKSHVFINLMWIVCTLQPQMLQAQLPASLSYDYRNGLPSNEVYDIFQDSAGFIWFTTDNGIVRFDGGEIKTFGTADGLTDPVVFGIHEDRQHRLWFRTYSGQLSWLRGDSIHPYVHNNVLRAIARKSIFQNLVMTEDGTLHFSAGYYIGRVDSDGKLHLDSLKSPGMLLRIVENKPLISFYASFLGASSPSPLINIEGKTYRLDLPGGLIGTHVVTSIKWKGQWWFGVKNALFCYDGVSVSRSHTAENLIYSLSVDRNDHLWIGYAGQGAEKFSTTDFRSSVRMLEPGVSVTRVLHDHEGGYWFSTLERGVLYVPHPNVQRIPLAGGKIRAAIAHRDMLLLGNQSGSLLMLDPTGTLVEIRKLPYGLLTAFRDRLGMLWLSTSLNTYILDENLREKLIFPSSKVGFSQSPNGKIWGTGGSNKGGSPLIPYQQPEHLRNGLTYLPWRPRRSGAL